MYTLKAQSDLIMAWAGLVIEHFSRKASIMISGKRRITFQISCALFTNTNTRTHMHTRAGHEDIVLFPEDFPSPNGVGVSQKSFVRSYSVGCSLALNCVPQLAESAGAKLGGSTPLPLQLEAFRHGLLCEISPPLLRDSIGAL